MADAIVGVLVGNLDSLIQKEIGSLLSIEDDMGKLSSTLTTILAVLEDAESKKLHSKPLEKWLAKLKDAAFEATDLLEEWSDNAQQTTYNNEVGESSLSCLSLKRIQSRHTISKKIKKIITRLDDIARERSNFHLNENVVPSNLQLEESRETGSSLTTEVVYGRGDDKENIIKILLNNVRSGEALSVLPVIGMGGIGKTTLAQWVYNDHRVISHFDERAWVCVSDNFEVKSLMKMMLESLDGKACYLETLDSVQRQLKGKLSRKKFLLVLDDVWNEDHEKWTNLKSVLKCGAQGSSILVTTRLEIVASMMATLPLYSLTCLSEEEGWLLFKDCAFGQGREEVDNLVEIGQEIVKKCAGIPLSVKSLGRLMWSKRTVGEWQQVRDSKIWELQEEEGSGILPALRLSYKHLPWHLKQCFAFCSIFQKDFKMDREQLIYLWMANGYLQSDGKMELEAFGKLIFHELVLRSFFQECKIETEYDIEIAVTCKMHDLMHDLACLEFANECSVVEVGRADVVVKCTRNMSLVFDSRTEAESSNRVSLAKSNSKLHTLIFSGSNKSQIEPAYILENHLYSLRALDLSGIKVETLPNSIGKMKLLKYLNLSQTKIVRLPKSISKLRNLKCLILRYCWSLKSFPKGTSKMRGLRHLDIDECDGITEMPSKMEQLTELRTLRGCFRVGPKSGAGVINGLKGMKQLRGVLTIRGLQYVRNAEANLIIDTQYLSLLRLDYSSPGRDEAGAGGELQEQVLEECLQPPPGLKTFFIIGYGGSNLPGWMRLQLQNVVEIMLEKCKRCVCLPPLGKLPLLKILTITWLDSLQCIGDDFYGEGVVGGGGRGGSAATTYWFPSLQQLEIQEMSSLEEWSLPSAVKEEEEGHRQPRAGVFPCLKELTIKKCPKLKAIPCLPCVQDISLWYCNEMILASIPNLPPHSLLTLKMVNFQEMIHLPEGLFINSSSSSTASLQSFSIYSKKILSLSREIQNLTALKSMRISDCLELNSLSELEGFLGKLTSLKTLSIQNCPQLKCLPVLGIQGGFNNSLQGLEISWCPNLTYVSQGLQHLTSLQTLEILHCRELEIMSGDGFQHLISLENLILTGLPKLRALPEGMQHLTMLKSLQISECDNLITLPEWLQRLTSLQSLEIRRCKDLRTLPVSLQHLNSLQLLEITICHPDLHKRCERDKGEDWHIISHIPQIYITEFSKIR